MVILVSLPIAGCTLAAAIAAGLADRKRPFSLLRLPGARLATLRRVVALESAVPLLAVAAVAIGTGFGAAADTPRWRSTLADGRARRGVLPHLGPQFGFGRDHVRGVAGTDLSYTLLVPSRAGCSGASAEPAVDGATGRWPTTAMVIALMPLLRARRLHGSPGRGRESSISIAAGGADGDLLGRARRGN